MTQPGLQPPLIRPFSWAVNLMVFVDFWFWEYICFLKTSLAFQKHWNFNNALKYFSLHSDF